MLFLLTCIPIVTIPCAMTAMSRVLGLSIQRKVCFPLSDYLHTFAGEWRRSSLVGLALFASLACALTGVWFYQGAAFAGATPLSGICLVIAFLILGIMVYAFPCIAFTDLSAREVLRNSLLLVVMRLPQTGCMLLLVIAFTAGVYLLMPYSVVIPLVFGCSFVGMCCVWVAWKGLQRYVISPGAPRR